MGNFVLFPPARNPECAFHAAFPFQDQPCSPLGQFFTFLVTSQVISLILLSIREPVRSSCRCRPDLEQPRLFGNQKPTMWLAKSRPPLASSTRRIAPGQVEFVGTTVLTMQSRQQRDSRPVRGA
ncbi:hypothetical protein VFPPC_15599 [Pochonia chlamydosporia 170]|uniref:Uncharacterized protein n=1 Tax=Pochonia chlamydosporia 170 TaxID=1380566 RepID=A0A179FY49_METCM|nr:hypothetical protein VFPPC_15599 [Pochonia chlamydosporia 170]OAQ70595.1 hypothetical protein VFPPC_15599 [Pochonia chlamydosporia 170]